MINFWSPENLIFAVIFFTLLYIFGVYIFMAPAFYERIKRSRPAQLGRAGLRNRRSFYTLIFLFSPLVFILALLSNLLWALVSLAAFVLLIVVYPFYWLYAHLPEGPDLRTLFAGWARFAGGMFEYSRRAFAFILGEPFKEEPEPEVQSDASKPEK